MSWRDSTKAQFSGPQQYHQLPREEIDEKADFDNDGSASYVGSAERHQTCDGNCWRQQRWKILLLHSCLIAINLAVSGMALSHYRISTKTARNSLISSPATDILRHVRHVFNGSDIEPYYIQPPSPEIDQRWHDLILGNFIRLSPEDLEKVGRLDQNPVLLDDGSGVGLVNSHHQIHCIMGLYQGFHPEYYWPNATEEQKASNSHHIDHCLDYLLQSSMCSGDVGFMTYHWDMDDPIPYWKAAEHECVDFDGLRGWMAERKAPIHEPGFIKHPKFGAPYPDGVEKIPTINDM